MPDFIIQPAGDIASTGLCIQQYVSSFVIVPLRFSLNKPWHGAGIIQADNLGVSILSKVTRLFCHQHHYKKISLESSLLEAVPWT